jgi:hypothetical protein
MHRLEAEQATVVWPARNRAGRFQVPPLQLAAGGANFRWRLTITLRGAPTVNPVIKIGCLEARRIDDPRPAYPLKAA